MFELAAYNQGRLYLKLKEDVMASSWKFKMSSFAETKTKLEGKIRDNKKWVKIKLVFCYNLRFYFYRIIFYFGLEIF